MSSIVLKSQESQDCLGRIITFLWDNERRQLGNVSNQVGGATYQVLLFDQLKDPDIKDLKNGDQMQMARQTYDIIIKSRFSIGKQYQCFKALSAALGSPQSQPESFSLFKRIALADIPHFILTRCWQVAMRCSVGFNFLNPEYNPITERSLSALIQAQKNFLLVSISTPGDCQNTCVPDIVFTNGNQPKLGLMMSVNAKNAFSETAFQWGKYSQMVMDKRWSRVEKCDLRYGISNLRKITVDESQQIAQEINKAVNVRLRFTTCEIILDNYLPNVVCNIVQKYLTE